VVSYFGAGVLRIAGLQQAGIGEVLLVDGAAAVVVQVLRDEFFWLCAAALVILAAGFRGIRGALATSGQTLLAVGAGAWLLGSLTGPGGGRIFRYRAARYAGMRWLVETTAPGIVTRKGVSEPLATGILAVDALVPVGRGQRELLVGDRQTGKTAIGLDTVLAQRGLGLLCSLAAVGQKATSTLNACLAIARHGAFSYASLSMASASASAVSQFLCPYTASAAASTQLTFSSVCFKKGLNEPISIVGDFHNILETKVYTLPRLLRGGTVFDAGCT